MLESYVGHLSTCTSRSLVRPACKILPSVSYTLLCTGIMSLNHNEHKLMNVIRQYNDKISVMLCWSFNWQVITEGQMFTRLFNLSITGGAYV